MQIEKDFFETLPSKSLIKKNYERSEKFLSVIMNNILHKISETISLPSAPTYKARIKSFESYYKKLLHLQMIASGNAIIPISDLIGVRIICAFIEDIQSALSQLQKKFDVVEVEQKGNTHDFKSFAYESTHVLIKIPNDCIPRDEAFADFSVPEKAVCEIQIRTILQDAWAEVEHELIYKSEFSPFDLPLRRKLAAINASLNLADIIFQEIRDYQKKLHSEVAERRSLFYAKADSFNDIGAQKNKFANEKIARPSPYVKGTIDDLLLEAIHAHNTGELQKAIHIYTQILESDAKPNDVVLSVIYKHRGMAHFTNDEFAAALSDFQKSFSLDKKNFRARYYEGIVQSILHNDDAALACFSDSLAINSYQAHAYFRRAEIYFSKNEFENARLDLDIAKKLGLNTDACNALYTKLLEKM